MSVYIDIYISRYIHIYIYTLTCACIEKKDCHVARTHTHTHASARVSASLPDGRPADPPHARTHKSINTRANTNRKHRMPARPHACERASLPARPQGQTHTHTETHTHTRKTKQKLKDWTNPHASPFTSLSISSGCKLSERKLVCVPRKASETCAKSRNTSDTLRLECATGAILWTRCLIS